MTFLQPPHHRQNLSTSSNQLIAASKMDSADENPKL